MVLCEIQIVPTERIRLIAGLKPISFEKNVSDDAPDLEQPQRVIMKQHRI